MKLIVKADDFGYTKSYNDGTIRAIREGIVTTVDLMLDCPGFDDAVEQIKNYPWITVGWHGNHFWGKPVLDPKDVPSMVNDEGRFKWRKDHKLMDTATYDDAYRELEAEVLRCIEKLGHAPFALECRPVTELDRAKLDVCRKYGIHVNVMSSHNFGTNAEADEPYRNLNIYKVDSRDQYNGAYDHDCQRVRTAYHPVDHFKNFLDTKSDITYLSSWHPGYSDDYIASESSMTICRDIDSEALCSVELKRWIIENRVELVSYEDAVLGTNHYQNYLRSIHSPLWMGKEARA